MTDRPTERPCIYIYICIYVFVFVMHSPEAASFSMNADRFKDLFKEYEKNDG